MPAGDLITGNWQVEIRGTLTGDGTIFTLDEPGISGLGAPPPKTHTDTPLDHADGTYQGRHFSASRLLTVPYVISVDEGTDEENAEAAGAAFVSLSALWVASETAVEMHFQLPGFGHRFVVGRPLGLADDLSLLRVCVARGLATFDCGDPTLTVVS